MNRLQVLITELKTDHSELEIGPFEMPTPDKSNSIHACSQDISKNEA